MLSGDDGKESGYPIMLYSGKEKCPVCGEEELQVNIYLYEVPYFGKVLFYVGLCGKCGYSARNVSLAEEQQPKKIIVNVNGERELRYLALKSSRAALKIRERNLEFIPTLYTPGLITTVEGLVSMFEEPIDIACKGVEDHNCRELKEWLKRAIEGNERFTIVLCDFDGGSKIIGEGVVETEIDEECRSLTRL